MAKKNIKDEVKNALLRGNWIDLESINPSLKGYLKHQTKNLFFRYVSTSCFLEATKAWMDEFAKTGKSTYSYVAVGKYIKLPKGKLDIDEASFLIKYKDFVAFYYGA